MEILQDISVCRIYCSLIHICCFFPPKEPIVKEEKQQISYKLEHLLKSVFLRTPVSQRMRQKGRKVLLTGVATSTDTSSIAQV